MLYGEPETGIEIVESFGLYEAEYAAIRKGVGILDMPQRGFVAVGGTDRTSFLGAMLTNKMDGLGSTDGAQGPVRRTFLLNRQGRIEADMIACSFDDDTTYLELDRCDAPKAVEELRKYLFSEDVVIEDVSGQYCHIVLHGPHAIGLFEHVTGEPVGQLDPMHGQGTKAKGFLGVYRRDEAGTVGLHLLVQREAVKDLYQQFADAVGGLVPQVEGGTRRPFTGRGIGWYAYNTARIEAGTPFYHIDFGPDSLPHEAGGQAMAEAVSFTKGCYVGQEIVARMENLGHPKRVLAGLQFEDAHMPIAGSQVLDADDEATIIGAVTSSALSPLNGNTAIGLAMMKWGKHRADIPVRVPAEGQLVSAQTHSLGIL